MQFMSLCNLHNALLDLARFMVQVRVRVRFRSDICILHICDFKIVARFCKLWRLRNRMECEEQFYIAIVMFLA